MSAGVGMAGSDMRRDDAEEAHDRIWQRLFIAYSASAYLRRSFTKLLRSLARPRGVEPLTPRSVVYARPYDWGYLRPLQNVITP